VITLNGLASITLESCTDTYTELGAEVADCETGLSVTIGGDTVDTDTPGIYTVTYNVTDAATNAATEVTRTVTVEDTTAPVVTCKGDANKLVNPYLITYEVLSNEFDATATDACGIATLNYVLSGATSGSGTSLGGVLLNLGNTTITWTATDVNGNSSECTTIVTVTKRPTSLVYNGETEKQYSDLVNLSALLTDPGTGLGIVGKNVKFTIGTQFVIATTNSNGNATATLILTQSPIPTYDVVTTFEGDGSYLSSSDTDAFDITPENALVKYNGVQLIATAGSNSSSATVTLRAVVQDISVTDLTDTWPGDIRNATVQFKIYDADSNSYTLIKSSSIFPVTDLLVSGNILTGLVSWDNTFEIGSNNSKTFGVEIIVNNYYTGQIDKEDLLITVYKPAGDFITGGGYIIPVNPIIPVAKYPSNPNTKTNFGFMVKYNKTGKNLQGNLNFIWRTEGGRIFQAKSNSMTSLGVNIFDEADKIAVFVAKCNVRDLSPLSAPIPNSGGLLMYVTMHDKGEPGNMDVIGFTIWNGNELWYSSNWNGLSTSEMNLVGGNLVVHSGFNLGTTSATTKITGNTAIKVAQPVEVVLDIPFNVTAYPNPSADYFTLKLQGLSYEASQKVEVNVFDLLGRQVYSKQGSAQDSYEFGQQFQVGVYLVTVKQGNNTASLKLIKK